MILLWFSCDFSTPSNSQICHNDSDCIAQAICVEQSCIEVACRSNLDCPLNQECAMGTCVIGCDVDSDCVAGQICSNHVCHEQGCRNAQLDCGYGEDCLNGECIVKSQTLCQLCTFEDWQISPLAERSCIIYTYDREEICDVSQTCVSDALCYPEDGLGHTDIGFCVQAYWFDYCEEDVDCPRPFTCQKDIYGDNSDINVCWADCPFWREAGVFE